MTKRAIMRVGVIGCGAAAEIIHLPALKRFTNIAISAFADRSINRARYFSKQFPGANAFTDFRAMLNDVDAVIITTPNFLHAGQSIYCLQKGVHVFCEKPMATSLADARRMVAEAKRRHRTLSIGMVRRHFAVYQHIKQLLDTKALGNVTSFVCEEGYPFAWPLQSTYAFEKDKAGGGVLMDLGSHIIDTLIYLFGDMRVYAYYDDSYGGVEANCVIDFLYKGVHGHVRLSRERRLKNSLRITCDNGVITSAIPQYSDVTIEKNGITHRLDVPHTNTEAVYKELNDFFQAALHNTTPLTGGKYIIPSIAIINQCYAVKKPLSQPWLLPNQ